MVGGRRGWEELLKLINHLIFLCISLYIGSEPEMCGNGIRCLAKFLRQLEGKGRSGWVGGWLSLP